MKAVLFTGAGGPDVVTLGEVPVPEPRDGEVLVRVKAAAMNRADLLQRRGLYPPPPGTRADIPGLELAGLVERCGPAATRWKTGDRVMAITPGEAQAEFAVVPERLLIAIPEGLSFEEAGAIPEAFVTAHDALFTNGGLQSGGSVLIHAAGSGVSTAAIQLAEATAATVIGTSRSADKLERCKSLGMDEGIVVDQRDPRFAEAVRRLVPAGVPLVLDFVGGPYLAENLACLATRGRLIAIGLMGGGSASVPLGAFIMKRLQLIGTNLRMRNVAERIDATDAFARDVLPLFAGRRAKPIVDSVMTLMDVRAAHERLERNDSFGKIVLVP